MLWCPSDGGINGLRFFEQSAGWDGTTIGITYGNYAGMMGTSNPGYNGSLTQLNGENGIFPDMGKPAFLAAGASQPPVRIPGIVDGTSNTILFGEKAHEKFSHVGDSAGGGSDYEGSNWWADSDFGDATMSSFYPPNPKFGPNWNYQHSNCDAGLTPFVTAASSFHSGGCNFAFADGSVKFLKDSIQSWNYTLIGRDANCLPVPNPTVAGAMPGVYQALSTRNGAEVISADQY